MSDETSEVRKCIVCHRRELEPTELQTCIDCIGQIRKGMIAILDNAALVSAEIAERAGTATPMDQSGAGGEDDPLPGGDALVMLAGGSGRWHHDDSTDIDSLVGLFSRWEDDWRETFEVKPNRRKAVLADAMKYLQDNLARAAQRHPAFDEFAKDVRTHDEALKRALRNGEPADKPAIRCPECGGQLQTTYAAKRADNLPRPTRTRVLVVKTTKGGERIERIGWTPSYDEWRRQIMRWNKRRMQIDQGGRRDQWRCTRCKQTLSAERYKVLVNEATSREALPAKDIALLLGVTASRIRQIVSKHDIEPVHSEGKVPYYRVEDVRQHARAKRNVAS